MIVVTGATGFIGSNLVLALIARGHSDLLVVDHLEGGAPLRYLEDLEGIRSMDKAPFLELVRARDSRLDAVELIFHQGACSDTTERDRDFLLRNNLRYSQVLAEYCQERGIPLIYASSAAVYGMQTGFREDPACEAPINEYAESKKLFDDWVRDRVLAAPRAQIVGLRYFNVYGPREGHKGAMSSVAFKMHGQLADTGKVQLFEGSHGYDAGEQRRDFVAVEDTVALNLWFMDRPELLGIFNCGTGRAAPFNAVATAVIEHAGHGEIEYIPFPEHLRERYQAFTQADLEQLRAIGYGERFSTVEESVPTYMEWLSSGAR